MTNTKETTKKVLDFLFLDTKKKIETKEKIMDKKLRKTIKDMSVLEKGCVLYKTSDVHFYQFTPERINKMMGTTLKDFDELEGFLQNADKETVEKMIDIDNLIFDGLLRYHRKK